MAQKKAVGFVIPNQEGKFLMQLRDNKPNIPYPAHWVFPGATVEEGEEPVEAVLREIPEEFEIGVSPGEVVFIGDYTRDDGVECFIYAYRGGKEPQKITEGQRFHYFSIEEIRRLPLGFQQNKFLLPLAEKYAARGM